MARTVIFGLSQVRQSAVFSGLLITERLAEEERTYARRGETIALPIRRCGLTTPLA
jgi:hypothetical protein